jgi:RNA recognition motif-containing protein
VHEKDIKGKKVEVTRHEKKEKREVQGPAASKFNNLFIKNLPSGCDDQGLKDMFAQFGEIESATV